MRIEGKSAARSLAFVALLLAAPVHAARVGFECDVESVRQHAGSPGHSGRFEVKCKTAFGNGIRYFTISSTVADAQDVARVSAMVTEHISSTIARDVDSSTLLRRIIIREHFRVSRLMIEFDDADVTTGPSYGCLAADCRNILAVILVPIDWTRIN